MPIADRTEVIERSEPEIIERWRDSTVREVPDPDFFRHCLVCETEIGWIEGAPYEGLQWQPFVEVEHTRFDPFRILTTFSVCTEHAEILAACGTTLAAHLSPTQKAS